MAWDQKLKRLLENLEGNPEKLAAALGITTRTLSDFMKPVSQGGREPTGPVQKLIDLLSDTQDLTRKPLLNLVLIHGDFRVGAGQDPAGAVQDMSKVGGRNNEFHYITVEPERDARYAMEALLRRRIQPHFFTCEPGLDSQAARDCYFSATAMWLATEAMRRDLAHITLAADARKFWPLARELKELAGVDLTLVREAGADHDAEVESFLRASGIGFADSSGRKIGMVTDLRTDTMGNISYGFITPVVRGADGQLEPQDGASLFFSYNHMFKDKKTGLPETEIGQLVVRDVVSYSIGTNFKGPCAIDVALVERPDGAPQLQQSIESPPRLAVARRARPEVAELIEIVKDAVSMCADEDGWALSANVGSRITVLHPNFKERLQAAGFQKIVAFAATHPDAFEVSDGVGTRYSAMCIRLKAA